MASGAERVGRFTDLQETRIEEAKGPEGQSGLYNPEREKPKTEEVRRIISLLNNGLVKSDASI